MTLGGIRPWTKKQKNIIRHHLRFFLRIFQLFMNMTFKIFKNIIKDEFRRTYRINLMTGSSL